MRWGLLLPAVAATAAFLAGSLPAAATTSAPAGTAGATATAGAPLYAFNTGLVLTVSTKPARGASVRVTANSGTAGQRWVVGSRQTLRPAANQKLCLNVPAARYRGGAKLQLWTCDGHASERFSTSAPSGHTAVFFLRPAARTKYCLTSLNSPPYEAGSRVGLAACAALTTQAWSRSNLDGVAGFFSGAFGIQVQRPTSAGAAITGDSTYANQLDQWWISTFTGARNASPVQLHPVEDTTLCASLASAEDDGAPLDLAKCSSTDASQQFSGIMAGPSTTTVWWAYLTTADSAYCVEAAASGSDRARPIVLGSCVGDNRDFWQTDLDLTTSTSGQFQEIYAGPATGPSGLEFSLQVGGSGGAGSGIVLARDIQAAGQIWTDLAPGQAKATGNPDGSITLRPLSDESLCLAVPGGDYAAGVQLTVQTCDGQVDQEFVRGQQLGTADLVAAGEGEFCVTAPGGIAAGSAVELKPCALLADQTWSTFFAWYGWAGQPLSGTGPVADPGDGLVLSGASAAGGQVGVAPSPGPASWYTSQDWLQVSVAGGFEIRSVYDPGLCLDAPGTAAGTQLTAAPCAGGTAQTFLYLGTPTAKGMLWWLRGTTSAKMCVAVGSVSSSDGLPLLLEPCSASEADEAWTGPSYQL